MDYAQVFEISASGMQVQKTRLEVAAHNLANSHTVKDANGLPFHPLKVISLAAGATAGRFAGVLDATATGVSAQIVADTTTPPQMVYEPGHPYANSKGFVAYPGVNHLTEMLTINEALRAYEANVAALQAARSMAVKALDIGGGQ